MKKNIFSSFLFLLLFVALAVMASAQEAPISKVLSQELGLKEAVATALPSVQFVTKTLEPGVRASVKSESEAGQPPIFLPTVRLNREQYQAGDIFQATLEFPLGTVIPERIQIGYVILGLQGQRGVNQAPSPEVYYGIRSQVTAFYIEDGLLAESGSYVFITVILDENGKQIALINNLFLVNQYVPSIDRTGYVRADCAELRGSQLFLWGGFVPKKKNKKGLLDQYVVVNGNLFPITKASGSMAIVDVDLSKIQPGVIDITFVAIQPGNQAHGYDSTNTPGALRVYLRH